MIPLKAGVVPAVHINMSSLNMTTERPTNADALGTPDPTWPPLSTNRFEGMLWSERLMCQARPAADDGIRFLAGLEVE